MLNDNINGENSNNNQNNDDNNNDENNNDNENDNQNDDNEGHAVPVAEQRARAAFMGLAPRAERNERAIM